MLTDTCAILSQTLDATFNVTDASTDHISENNTVAQKQNRPITSEHWISVARTSQSEKSFEDNLTVNGYESD